MLLAGAWLAEPLCAQPHFAPCAERTGANAILVIPTSADPRIGDEPLDDGDEIAVVAATGRCAGRAVWDGQNIALTAWGDNPMTEATDGLAPGGPMSISVWDASRQVEYNASNSTIEVVLATHAPYLADRLVYAPDAIYVVEHLHVLPFSGAVTKKDAR